MSLHAVDDVGDAVEAAREFLFPVDRSRWLRLAVVAFFVASGFGMNAPFNAGSGASNGGVQTSPPSEFPDPLPDDFVLVIAVVVAAIALLAVLFGLLASIMEFVLVESLREEAVHVRRYTRRYLGAGLRLFLFRLALFAVAVGIVLGVVFVAGPSGTVTEWTDEQVLSALFLVLPLLVILLPLVALLDGFTVDFVVPTAVLGEGSILGAWRRFAATLRGNLGQYAAYVLVKFFLSIVIGVLAATVTGIAAVLIAIPFLVVGLVAFFVGGTAFTIPVIAVLGILGVVFVLLVIAVAALVQVPLQTFLRYYALLVLGDTDADLDLIPERRAAIRE
ncbi:DUF7544 domain-containing protein [Halorientalis halophila]|uniref:DUF7544 domain-containing protein n=1 Tax=Halorientalis halophila TaxID=3108499 RepID=UPI00300BCF58